jgi:hypothetical protein
MFHQVPSPTSLSIILIVIELHRSLFTKGLVATGGLTSEEGGGDGLIRRVFLE